MNINVNIMKLVVDLLGLEYGKSYGFQEYLFNLLDDFCKYRDKILAKRIVLLVQSSQSKYFRERFGDVFVYKCFTCSSLFSRIFKEGQIIGGLKLEQQDILLFVGNTMPIVNTKAKKVLVVHDLLFRHGAFFSKTPYYYLFRLHRYFYIPYSLAKADKIIAISNFTKNEISKAYNVPEEKIETIYNYFNFDKYDKDKLTEKSVIHGKYILCVCANYKHKNHITVLKAFEQFCKVNKDFNLVFIGSLSSDAYDFIRQLDSSVKNKILIRQHLTNADMKKVYTNASMFVSASLYEGLGMPVVEALYFGLPTLLSDISIHHEVSMDMAQYFPSLSYEVLSELFVENATHRKNNDTVLKSTLIKLYDKDNTSMRYINLLNHI